MPTRPEDVTSDALSLPAGDRVTVALALWESLADEDRAKASPVDPQTLAEVQRRDRELSQGTVAGRSHGEVMTAARNALR